MTIKAIIPAKEFLYLTRFASTEETRFYLNGVQIEPMGASVAMVATDGRILGALKLESYEARANGASFILSSCKELVRAAKGKCVYLVCRESQVDIVRMGFSVADVAELESVSPDISIPAKIAYVDGTFPEWRKVLPEGNAVPRQGKYKTDVDYCVGLDPTLLANFAGMGASQAVSFDWNGDNAILVANPDPRFIGVIMPHNSGETPDAIKARRGQFFAVQTIATTAEAAE